MTKAELENLEISLLLEAMYRHSGYDFRSYARASIGRRIRQFLPTSGCNEISELIPKALRDEEFLSRLIQYFSISVTEMFRDPAMYKAIREKVIPILRTYPFLKIWHAGCATGEEVYSLAIVLKEEGLYERSTIYATDFNDAVLQKAKAGIYENEKIRDATKNYQEAGGTESFADYYHSKYNAAAIDVDLRKNITFANHNLASDSAFGEMHFVFCRNVLIYFNRELQNKALKLFYKSMVHNGFLVLGTKETIDFTEVANDFRVVDSKMKIYRKQAKK